MENLAPKQVSEPTSKEKAKITEKALHVIEQFQEQFPDYKIIFSGIQPGYNLVDDMYLFTIDDDKLVANGAMFTAKRLDLQSVENAFVEKMKLFGEDIKEIV